MPYGYFICNGLHQAKDYPKKKMISTLMIEGSQDESQEEDSGKENACMRLNPLQLLNAIRSEELPYSRLLYVNINIRGEKLLALIDSSVTNNFIVERLVRDFGLAVEACNHQIKAVNLVAQVVHSMASGVQIFIGNWNGKANFISMPLDDFDIILAIEFLVQCKDVVMPYLNELFVMDE